MKEAARRLDAVERMLPELENLLLELQTGHLAIDHKSNDFDLVTQADFASEKRLVEFIREAFPEDGLLAEEGSRSTGGGEEEKRFRWILDPIDGTVNYANNLPVWAISIGLLHGNAQVGGIVSGPGLGLRYRALRNGGATRNGTPIQVNAKTNVREGLVGTGFPYNRATHADVLGRTVANMLRDSGGLRRLGAAALDFCFVADGKFLAYYEMQLQPWDTAAGSLIAREAGATVTDLHGHPFDPFTSQGVLTSNGPVHQNLLQAVSPLREL